MDLSEQCGYSVEAQCKLFQSIKPLFANKPTMLVMNKIDVTRLEDLSPENRALVEEIINAEDVMNVQVSCYTDEGVMELKTKACDALLEHRVDQKLKGNKINSILNRLHVAQPKARDEVVREPFIPDVVKNKKTYDKEDPVRRRLERDIELEEGGAGVYNINLKSASLSIILLYNPTDAPRRRELHALGPGMEHGHHARDRGWQEHCRLYRSRHPREARRARTGGGEAAGRRVLRQR